MADFDKLEQVRLLSPVGDTNSRVDLMVDKSTEQYFVRKTILGISQPLYQAIFMRETRALYALNSCPYIVSIYDHKNMVIRKTKEKVGCIFLEHIQGVTLSRVNLARLSSKARFSIVKQLIFAIETAHAHGIIHRDINPSNIMITDENEVKVIDFGICKIKNMLSSSTVFQLATNKYAAPEVHLHSDNATEQSDLYSIGAVIYYLFSGKEPPLAPDFDMEIAKMTGIDVELKPILKKLVMQNPANRYADVFTLINDLSVLFERFLYSNQQLNVVMNVDQLITLKKRNLVPSQTSLRDLRIVSRNFIDIIAFRDDSEVYQFVGMNFLIECVYNEYLQVFEIVNTQKIVPIEREKRRKYHLGIPAKIHFIDIKIAHRQNRNDSYEIKNAIDSHYYETLSSKNVHQEYKARYGAWRILLERTKNSIEDQISRYEYSSFSISDHIVTFFLEPGTILGNDPFSKEQVFIIEKQMNRKKHRSVLIAGFYDNDYFDGKRIVLKLRSESSSSPNFPKKGVLCLDYRREMINVMRQLEALDAIEKEDYSCTYPLKSIISGVTNPPRKMLEQNYTFFNTDLDISQQAAVKKALNSESLSIVQGPPGTGKTSVIIEIIMQVLRWNKKNPELPGKKILLVSQSHPAVDKMVSDLVDKFTNTGDLSLLRVGRDEKLNEGIKEKFSLSYVRDRWIELVQSRCTESFIEHCGEIGVSTAEFETYFGALEKTRFSKAELNISDTKTISDMLQKTNSIHAERNRQILEIQLYWRKQLLQCDDINSYMVKTTGIIAGTCIGFLSNKELKEGSFDYLIIDEAAKATFPELAVSLRRANNIILVGDHKQLPPILDTEFIDNNKELDRGQLETGIFETLFSLFPEDNKQQLTVQYRMHPTIGSLISQVFYNGELQNGVEGDKRVVPIENYKDIAIEWLSTSTQVEELRYEKAEGKSPKITYRNDLEIQIIIQKLLSIDKLTTDPLRIGVITAYSAQKHALSNVIRQHRFINLDIEIDTVDAFQGSQKEIIIYSTVRSSNDYSRIV